MGGTKLCEGTKGWGRGTRGGAGEGDVTGTSGPGCPNRTVLAPKGLRTMKTSGTRRQLTTQSNGPRHKDNFPLPSFVLKKQMKKLTCGRQLRGKRAQIHGDFPEAILLVFLTTRHNREKNTTGKKKPL